MSHVNGLDGPRAGLTVSQFRHLQIQVGKETHRTCQVPVTRLLMGFEGNVSERPPGQWGRGGKGEKTRGVRHSGIDIQIHFLKGG